MRDLDWLDLERDAWRRQVLWAWTLLGLLGVAGLLAVGVVALWTQGVWG